MVTGEGERLTRPPRPPAPAAALRRLLVAAVGATLAAAAGCAIGPDQAPGCQSDADCGQGWLCRAGACFETTTGRSGPVADGGDAGVEDAGDGG